MRKETRRKGENIKHEKKEKRQYHKRKSRAHKPTGYPYRKPTKTQKKVEKTTGIMDKNQTFRGRGGLSKPEIEGGKRGQAREQSWTLRAFRDQRRTLVKQQLRIIERGERGRPRYF